MLENIIDRRTNPYTTRIDAAFQPTVPKEAENFAYDEAFGTTVAEACKMAQTKWTCKVTVYLYDVGSIEHDDGTTIEVVPGKAGVFDAVIINKQAT